jgi:hypothetical protein
MVCVTRWLAQVAALLLRMYDVEGEGCVVLDGADVKTIEAR